MQNRIVHIIFVPDNKDRLQGVIHQICTLDLFIVPAASPLQIRNILSMLDHDAEVVLWVHVNQNEKDLDGYPSNLVWSDRLRGNLGAWDKVVHREAKVYFFTTVGVDKVKGELLPEGGNLVKQTARGEWVYAFGIFYEKNRKHVPPTQTVGELLRGDWQKAPPYAFKHPFGWGVRQFRQTFDDRHIEDILGAMIPEGCDSCTLEVLKPGFSGSFILKASCKRQQETTHYVLKISKNQADLDAEFRLTQDNRFFYLPKSKFLIAEPLGNERLVHGWTCLRSRFAKDKETLRSYLRARLNDPSADLCAILSRLLDSFAEFDATLRDQENGSVADYLTGVPPLSGGFIQQGAFAETN